MVSHMATHGIGRDGSKIVKSEVKIETGLNSGGVQTLTGLWEFTKSLPGRRIQGCISGMGEICDNITLRQSVSQRLRKIFALVDKATGMVLFQSHNTTRRWIMAALTNEKITI